MPYFFESDYALYGTDRIDAALQRWRPDSWRTFTSAMEETYHDYNTLGWVSSKLAESVSSDDSPIMEDNWNDSHPLYRDDIPYTSNMTEGIALARATESDRDARMAFTRQNVDFWSLPNLTGTLLGGLPDPVNLAGAGGFLGRVGTVAKLAQKMPVVKYTAPVLQGSADTALAESLFQFTRASVAASRGEDLDQFSILTEIGLASVFGGAFSTIPMAWQIAKKAPSIMHYNWLAQARNQIGREGDSVTIFGREGMDEPDISVNTADAQARNAQKQSDMEEENVFEEFCETIDDDQRLFEGENQKFDETIDDRTWKDKVADDLKDAVMNPGGTIRNAYEYVANCMLSVRRKKL